MPYVWLGSHVLFTRFLLTVTSTPPPGSRGRAPRPHIHREASWRVSVEAEASAVRNRQRLLRRGSPVVGVGLERRGELFSAAPLLFQ
ncbi:hypothetical protein EYF80_042238 [Liparis tanakae]|uniref:Secreted protein n=1 Tax=Liparis tanakae TaxID=230148 RepID=A0A4Z2G1X2_9TELE|nr:hypothetical protein EYF80_042238 [Liparis tanakae]